MEISARSGGRDPLDEPGWVVPIANSLVGADRAAPAALAGAVAGAEAGSGPALSPRHSVRPLQRHSVATPAAGGGVRLGADMLAAAGPVAGGRGLRPAAPGPARRAESSRRARQITGLRGRLPHPGKTWGCRHRPSPVDRQQTPLDLRRPRHPPQSHHYRGRTSTTSPRPSPRSTASRRSRAAPDGLAAGPKPIGKVFVPPGRPLTRPASQTGRLTSARAEVSRRRRRRPPRSTRALRASGVVRAPPRAIGQRAHSVPTKIRAIRGPAACNLAVSAGQRPHKACTTSTRRTFWCRTRRRSWASSRSTRGGA